MRLIGVDIGTTTISLIVLDTDSGEQLACVNIPNPGTIAPAQQDPDRILDCVKAQLAALKRSYGPIDAIGIDGQMHGMLYTDKAGRAVSPLYTWQDGHGQLKADGETMAQKLSRLTGHAMASGYGLTTHFCLSQLGKTPENAAKIASIGDYAAMTLCGKAEPVCHASNAASMGLFDAGKRNWDLQAAARAGIDPAILPRVLAECRVIGEDADGTPVCCAVGDNQASFFGAVADTEGSVLVNIGTGGQVSMAGHAGGKLTECEIRPLEGESDLIVGSSLCGGRAYALTHRFILGCARLAGCEAESVYEQMNAAALAMEDRPSLLVDTRLCGSRAQPQARGSITQLGEENFDAAQLVCGVLWGMADELHAFYREMTDAGAREAKVMIGSGNGIRRNPALRRIMEKRFGLKMQIPAHGEEAAYGAALYAASALTGRRAEYARRMIRYLHE